MHRAAYPFKHENSKILSFKTRDLFLVLKENDNGWWLCLAQNGRIGLVPGNYIEPFKVEYENGIKFVEEATQTAPKHKQYFSVDYLPTALSALEKLKQHLHLKKQATSSQPNASSLLTTPQPESFPLPPNLLPLSPLINQGSTQGFSNATSNNISTSNNNPTSNSNTTTNSIEIKTHNDTPMKDSKKDTDFLNFPSHLFWTLVIKIRESTDIDFEGSQNVLKMLLQELSSSQPLWREGLNSLLHQSHTDLDAAINITQASDVDQIQTELQNLMLCSKDSVQLSQLLEQVSDVVEDGQQSSWQLFEDLQANTQLLSQLLDILRKANHSLVSSILSRDSFQACHSLVLYYQMETRAPLRRLLLEIFRDIIQLQESFKEELSSSVLSVEFVREIMSASQAHKIPYDVINLLSIFFTCESIPQQHYSVVNVAFVTHVLTLIEDDEQEDGGDDNDAGSSQQERLIELLIELNVHFDEQNIFIEALTQRPSHKHLTEYLLVLFNRAGAIKKACLKLMTDIFSQSQTSGIFYTNDANVLIDVTCRCVCDLPPGDQERTEHLKLLHLMLSNREENRDRHAHIHSSLQQILSEDPSVPRDVTVVQNIMHLVQ